jgi:hypothetical protein
MTQQVGHIGSWLSYRLCVLECTGNQIESPNRIFVYILRPTYSSCHVMVGGDPRLVTVTGVLSPWGMIIRSVLTLNNHSGHESSEGLDLDIHAMVLLPV